MIKLIIKIISPIFISIICGIIFGKLIYKIYDNKIDTEIKGEKIYLIQAGAYKSYDNMIKNTSINNYIYYEDEDGLYKSIIAITEDKNNIDKIKKSYGKEVLVNEYYSLDEELNKRIKNYDKDLRTLSDNKEIQNKVLEILKLYKNDDKKTLIKISS